MTGTAAGRSSRSPAPPLGGLRRRTAFCLAAVFVLGAALVSGVGPDAAAQENASAVEREDDTVRSLLPRLRSDDAAVRAAAEDELFRLGEAAREALQQLSRSDDNGDAALALRLLGSERWGTVKAGERTLERIDAPRARASARVRVAPPADDRVLGGAHGGGMRTFDEAMRAARELLDGLGGVPRGGGAFDDEMRRSLDAMRDTLLRDVDELVRELDRDVRGWSRRLSAPGAAGPRAGGPDDLGEVFERFRRAMQNGSANGVSQRSTRSFVVERDGRRVTCVVDSDGGVSVEERDRAATEARTFESPSVDAFRDAYPDVAERLDSLMPQWAAVPRSPRSRAAESGRGGRGSLGSGGATLRDALRRLGRPAPLPPAAGAHGGTSSASRVLLGIQWSPLGNALAAQLSLGHGVVVDAVSPRSRAESLGLARHDVLLSLDGRAVRDGADVRRIVAGADGRRLRAEVVRRGRRVQLTE